MKDNFKDWVEDERAAFEFQNPDLDGLWENIDNELKKSESKKNVFWKATMKIAASILIVCMCTWVGFRTYNYKQFVHEGAGLTQISSELAETEVYYASQVSEKLEIIKANDEELHIEVASTIEELDEEYQLLKQDLNDQADNEEVIEAMIDNYRLKLDLLEKILSELQTDEKAFNAKKERNL